jgi:putative hydrolase of the HAD superfamily
VEYFHKAVGILRLPPDEMLFIDDHDRNVESARVAGLQSQRFHLDDGLDALRSILERYGVTVL